MRSTPRYLTPYQQNAINGQSLDLYQVPEPTRLRSILNDVCSDQGHYYSGEGLGKLAIGVGAAAALANTSADERLRNFYQDHLGPTQALHAPKIVGEGWYTLPVFAASAIAGSYFDDVPLGHGVGEWGSRALRTILFGALPMLAVLYIIGASRPGRTSAGSHWKPFDDANGASGHAFMGAVPFPYAAKMTEDPFWKGGYTLHRPCPVCLESTVTPITRPRSY